jgi:hypothetical protein
MKNIYLPAYLYCALALSGCCDMDQASERLRKILDSGDAKKAVKAMEDPCISKIPRIEVTKALLLLRLSMDEPDAPERKILRERGLALLKMKAESGDPSARSFLDDYDRWGESYLEMFPWSSLLGPSPHVRPPRGR